MRFQKFFHSIVILGCLFDLQTFPSWRYNETSCNLFWGTEKAYPMFYIPWRFCSLLELALRAPSWFLCYFKIDFFVATVFYIPKRRVDMAFNAASFSKINICNGSFLILKQFNFSGKRRHSASTLFPVLIKLLFSATTAKGESITTSVPGSMKLVAMPLPDSIRRQELATPPFPCWDTQASPPARSCDVASMRPKKIAFSTPLFFLISVFS